MIKQLRNKKGFLAPFAYFTLIAMTIYVAAFVKHTIDDHFITERNLYNLQSKWQALTGIECLVYELKAQGQDWYTHTAVKDEKGIYHLQPLEKAPKVVLNKINEIDKNGNYAAKDGSFSAMCYISPSSSSNIIYSLGGESLYAAKFNYLPFVDYFIFTPYQLSLSHITLDGLDNNLGGIIHSNEDIVFGDKANLLNIAMLSTPEAVRYFVESYVPEGNVNIPPDVGQEAFPWESHYYWLRYPWVEPYSDPFSGDPIYRNRNDGHAAGEKTGLLMEDPSNPGNYIDWDPASGNSYIDPDINPSIYADSNLISYINGTILSNRLNQSYLWDKYWRMTEDFGDFIKTEIEANYTNSKLQPKAWDHFVQSQGLKDVIEEANTEGKFVSPLTVDAESFKHLALENGLSVQEIEKTSTIKIGGTTLYFSQSKPRIEIDNKLVFEFKTFINTNSNQNNAALIIYLDNMIDAGLSPANGIIYSEMPIILENAEQLPEGGLTVFSHNNIYIKGDYNTADWQPAAAIAAGYIYLLSDQFNYPKTSAPDTFHNLDFPYQKDFVAGEKNWYAQHQAAMANPVDKDYTYVVSLVSHHLMPDTLERWWYYRNPGDINNPPSYNDVVSFKRQVIGSLAQLPADNILLFGQNDEHDGRYRGRKEPGWPNDMTSLLPIDEYNYFSYDKHYLEHNADLIPPGLSPLKDKIKIRLKSDYWNNRTHCVPLN